MLRSGQSIRPHPAPLHLAPLHLASAHPASSWFDYSGAQALQTSFKTLQAGCDFLIARADQARPAPDPRRSKVAMRLTGNHLKELDRFFSLLIEEYRAFLQAMAPQTYQRRPADLHPLDKHRPRLRAIRRLQIAACEGPVRDHCALTARDLAVASLGLSGGRQSAGRPFAIDDRTLAEIARFYLVLAGDVVGLA